MITRPPVRLLALRPAIYELQTAHILKHKSIRESKGILFNFFEQKKCHEILLL